MNTEIIEALYEEKSGDFFNYLRSAYPRLPADFIFSNMQDSYQTLLAIIQDKNCTDDYIAKALLDRYMLTTIEGFNLIHEDLEKLEGMKNESRIN